MKGWFGGRRRPGSGPDENGESGGSGEAAPPKEPQRHPVTFRFDIVMRGYDRDQVDTYLDLIEGQGFTPPVPKFFPVMRGYDKAQVDARIEEIRAQSEV